MGPSGRAGGRNECRRAERRAGGRVECIKGVLGVLRVGYSDYSQSERPIPRGEPRWGVAPGCASGPLLCQRTLVAATPDRTICTTVASTRRKAPLRRGLKSGVSLVLRSARRCHRMHGVCSTPLLTRVTSILPGVAKPASSTPGQRQPARPSRQANAGKSHRIVPCERGHSHVAQRRGNREA